MSQFHRRNRLSIQAGSAASARSRRGVESLAFLAAFSFTAALVLGVFH